MNPFSDFQLVIPNAYLCYIDERINFLIRHHTQYDPRTITCKIQTNNKRQHQLVNIAHKIDNMNINSRPQKRIHFMVRMHTNSHPPPIVSHSPHLTQSIHNFNMYRFYFQMSIQQTISSTLDFSECSLLDILQNI